MSLITNRIHNLGCLKLGSHEDLSKKRTSFTEEPYFRTTLRLEFDSAHQFLHFVTQGGWATMDCFLSVGDDGVWTASQLLSKDLFDWSVDEALQICEGDPVAAFELTRDKGPIQFTQESFKVLADSLATLPVGRLISRLARSLEYNDSRYKKHLHVHFGDSPMEFCKMVAGGSPFLELSFDPCEIRDVAKFVNSLASKMSKWWAEISKS